MESVRVRLLKRTMDRNGGLLLAGETVAFSQFVAEDLVQRGGAQWVSGPVRNDAAGLPPDYVREVLDMKDEDLSRPASQKGFDGPEQNKMQDGRRTKKK